MKTFAINILNEVAEECEKKLIKSSTQDRAIFLNKVSQELTEIVEGLSKNGSKFSNSRIPGQSKDNK